MRSVYLPIRLIRFLLALFLLPVGIFGISYSLFSSMTDISSSVSTGNIDVIFSDVHITDNSSSSPSPEADIENNGKSIAINIEKVLPGDTVTFYYEVRNNGTVPVVYELSNFGGESIMNISADNNYICAGGGTGKGNIRIAIGDDAQPNECFDLYLELNFQQAIVVSS